MHETNMTHDSDPNRRARRTHRMGRRIAGAVLGGITAFTGPNLIASPPTPPPEISHTADPNWSNHGMCELTPQNLERLETACKVLPPITEGANFKPLTERGDHYDEVEIASLSKNDANLEALPPEFQEAFLFAASDPIAKKMLEQYPVRIVQSFEESDNAFFDEDKEEVVFRFNVTNPEPSEIYRTYGTILAVWMHEATGHGTFDLISDNRDKDEEAKKLYKELSDLCMTDQKIAIEQYRTVFGDELRKNLFDLQSYFEDDNVSQLSAEQKQAGADSIFKLLVASNQPNELSKLLVQRDKRSGCVNIPPTEYIARELGLDYGLQLRVLIPLEKDDLYTNLEDDYEDGIASQYTTSTETDMLSGMSAGGHPWENGNEYLASTLALVQANPIDFANGVRGLTIERQKSTLNYLMTLERLLEYGNIDIKDTNLPYVIFAVNQSIENYK